MASYRGTRNLSTGPPIGTVEIRLAAEFMERFGRACGESEIRSSWREICRWSGFRNSLHRQARSDQGPAVTWRWLTGVADVAKKQNDVMLPSQILGCSRFWDWRARQYAEARDFAAVVQLPTADRDIKLRLAAIALSCLLALPSDLRVMHALAGPYTASGLAMYAVDIILPYNERLGSPFKRSRLGQVEQLRAGTHYPRSAGEFQAWFRADEDCLDYLEWLRWPGGFTCPSCGHAGGWRLGDGRFECAACHRRTSVTAGTFFDRTRTPLTVWFTACWLFATQKDGISAQSLQRSLEIGSYPTAWAMLHRLRSVLVRPGRDRLSGTVQVDETFLGGAEPGLRGGRAPGKKVLTGIAVEVSEPKGIGRCRMAVLADGSAESLHPFITGAVEPGARVITDGWKGYCGLDGLGYTHDRRSQRAARARGDDPGELLPAVHRVASLARRWLLGTHQGSVDEAHLPGYLNEFAFRFNRRRSASRGLVFYRLLELAAGHDPVRYRDLIVRQRSKAPPAPPGTRGHPPSLERPGANRPWRAAEMQLRVPYSG